MDRFFLLVFSLVAYIFYGFWSSKYNDELYVSTVVIWSLFYVYFFPWLVSWCRRHNNSLAIFVLNFFLGWTLIGWVASLVWGCFKANG